MLSTYSLKNGLKVATFSIPQMRSVNLSISVKGGSIFDKAENSGTAHFMEHVLVEGTPSFPRVEDLSDFMEGLAGRYNATTHSHRIQFYLNVPSKYLTNALKIASEVFFQPLFAEDAVEKERRAIAEEIRQRRDALWYKNNQFFSKVRYKPNHPLRLDPGGSLETVLKLQKPNLVEYWSKFFYPKNTYLVLVGGFSNSGAKKLIKQTFGGYSSKKSFPGFPRVTNDDFTTRAVAIRHDAKLQTCYIDLTFPSIDASFSMEDRITQVIIRDILGGLRRSRLFRLLRERKGLVYDVHAGSSLSQGFGLFYIASQAVPANLDEVLSLIASELIGFVSNGPTQEELDFCKNFYTNQVLMNFDHPSNVAGWIEGDLLWEDRPYTPEGYAKIAEGVDLKDLVKFMDKNWDFKKLNLTVQGPIENSKSNVKRFEQILKDI